MRRLAMVLWLVLWAAQLLAAQELKIGIIGDQTMAPAAGNQYEMLKLGVASLSAEHPDIVLHTGDLLESLGPDFGPAKPDVYTALFHSATGILNQLPCNWHLAAGDHDVNPPFFKPNEDTIRKLFQTLYAPAEKHLYYSFNFWGYHFIALSSQESPNADPRWGVIFRSHISAQQLDWLRQDLRRSAGALGIIVFMHQPLWYQWADWAPVHSLLRSARVSAVIAGHFHYNQDEGELDGIRYIVVGATGGATKIGSAEAGDLQHVTVLNLNHRRIHGLKVLPLRGEPVRSFSSRRDMDRLQALDVNLGNYFNDTSANANRVKQIGTANLWKSCLDERNASLALRSVGNPLDVVVIAGITINKGNFEPKSSTFNPKLCPGTDGARCELAPGSLIDFSNNSSVQPSCRSCKDVVCAGQDLGPLWTAQFPSQTSDGQPVSQSFTLTMSFRGESGRTLELQKVFSLVSGCAPP